jgi:hypothetical protein
LSQNEKIGEDNQLNLPVIGGSTITQQVSNVSRGGMLELISLTDAFERYRTRERIKYIHPLIMRHKEGWKRQNRRRCR